MPAMRTLVVGVAAWAMGCANEGVQPSRAPAFTLEVEVAIGDPSITAMRVDGVSYPVMGRVATATVEFESYDAARAAGAIPVEFMAGASVHAAGTVAAGACETCVYNGCPTPATLARERLEFIGEASVAPEAYVCWVCAGGGAEIQACQ